MWKVTIDMRLRIDCAYDGTDFYGWARQPDRRTVQGEIEQALAMVLHLHRYPDVLSTLRLTVAGRTDTGVHAQHQVCHIDIPDYVLDACVGHMSYPAPVALERRLRHVVPDDIAIHRVVEAPEGFDARFSATTRTYVYRICDNGQILDPRMRHAVLQLDYDLDVNRMNAAAAMIAGLRDFGSFAQPNPGGTTIREVKAASWQRVGQTSLFGEQVNNSAAGHVDAAYNNGFADITCGDGLTSAAHSDSSFAHGVHGSVGYDVPHMESGLLCFRIVADAFAHNMVRSLVQATIQIGRGRRSLEWFADKLEHPRREGDTGPAPAKGLTLEYVDYPPHNQLAARAQAIRAKRTLP